MQERKEAEANAKLLDNRLNLLKGEEKKAWKKIENTKKKANDKLQYLLNIVQNNKKKVEVKKQREKEILEKKEQNKKMNENIKKNNYNFSYNSSSSSSNHYTFNHNIIGRFR